MSGLCEGRVAIVTGAARGIGREHALLLAKEGAKVVVNDLGGSVDGSGADISPAQSVVNEIEAMGSEAVVNGDDVSSFDGAKNMVDQAINHFGRKYAKITLINRFAGNFFHTFGNELHGTLKQLRRPFYLHIVAIGKMCCFLLTRVPHPRLKGSGSVRQPELQIKISLSIRAKLFAA